MRLPDLPVRAVLPDVAAALRENRPVVLQAPPGTGKTLLTAPYLLDAPWLAGRKIVLLEPRRLAARMAAGAMARMMGERTGETVGYQVRLERCAGPATRIEILTEGLLVQRLLHDPELADTGLVIFDEFHERSVFADFAMAMTRDMRDVLRPDLRIVAMSATVDAEGLANYLGADARVVRATARTWPVETHYLAHTPSSLTPLHETMASAIVRALRETEGGILAFLPGEGEIRRTEAALAARPLPPGVDVRPLYGALPKPRQDAAVEPAPPSRRKVVLSTSIAESSLTIQDISVVIDGGFSRVSRFSPLTGMSRLETIRVTKDRADQRRGRAGRLGPGVCYRLWDETTDARLAPESVPEILDADLAPTRLQSAMWGAAERDALPWPTPPPAVQWRVAGDLLHSLGALDVERRITKRGRRLASIAAHPRLAHMIDRAAESGWVRQAALCAAVVEEAGAEPRIRGEDDARRLVERVAGDIELAGETSLPRDWIDRVRKLARQWGMGGKRDAGRADVGRLLSWAFPDRIAQRRDRNGLFRTADGHGAKVLPESGLAGEKWIVIAEMQDNGTDAAIRLAAPLLQEDIEADFAEAIETEEVVSWDARSDRVVAARRRKLGSLVLSESALPATDSEKFLPAVLDGIRRHGVANLGWTPETRNLQARIAFLARVLPDDGWPDVSDAALEARLEDFIGGFIGGRGRWQDIAKIDLAVPLNALCGHRSRELEALAPSVWMLPCGHRARIRYDQGDVPVVSAKLQDFFGVRETPKLARGASPVRISLLSPAQRPVAVTDDLAGFWREGYPLVRKEMRGRYPKHPWPEDPSA